MSQDGDDEVVGRVEEIMLAALEALAASAEAQWATAETEEERVEATALEMLVAWQRDPPAQASERKAGELVEALREALAVLDLADDYGFYEPGSLGDADIKDSRDQARAALALYDNGGGGGFTSQSLRSAPSDPMPKGWRLVPEEPTEGMCAAYLDAEDASLCIDPLGAFEDGYRAMLAAAPTLPRDADPACEPVEGEG